MNLDSVNPVLLQAGAPGADPSQNFIMLGAFALIFVVFYFMIIRPQNKKQKELKKKLAALKKGDRVQTIGGLRGNIHTLKDDSVLIQVDDNCKMEFVRSAIAEVIEAKPALEQDESKESEKQ